ncbi:winged helix-turn-helix domain-containing protein [Xenorhabdus koppenhoeferi]|uniref:winged helix-turn-helix domain-containing protein n=1 Tax=Xenorhabdus koppenhoeferi TaxID=351659 RepID=UPI003BB5551B
MVDYVWTRWQVTFTVAGMTKWLHRQDFFHVTLPEKGQELATRLTDNFQTLIPASSS